MHRQDIPKVVKYSYLKGVLRGSAASAVTGVSVTNDGYDVAIRILHERFGNKEAIIEAIIEALFKVATSTYQQLQTSSVIFNILMILLRNYCDSWNHRERLLTNRNC